MPSTTILVTGGAGYVGSHTIVELLGAGYNVVVVSAKHKKIPQFSLIHQRPLINFQVDNMCNAHMNEKEGFPESLRRVQLLTNRTVAFHKVDIRDRNALDAVFKQVSLFIERDNV